MIRDELDGRQHEIDLGVAPVVRERNANPPWLDAQKAARNLGSVELALGSADAEKAMPVGARARAAGAVLDTVPVFGR